MHWIIVIIFSVSIFFLYRAKRNSQADIVNDNIILEKEKKEAEYDEITAELADWENELKAKEDKLSKKEVRLSNKMKKLERKETELNKREKEVKKTALKRKKDRLEDINFFKHFDITKAAFNDAVKNLDYNFLESFIAKLYKKTQEYYSGGRNGAKYNIKHQGKVQSIDSNKLYEFYFGPNNDGRAYFRRRKKQNGYLILKVGKKDNQKEDIAWIDKTYNGSGLL